MTPDPYVGNARVSRHPTDGVLRLHGDLDHDSIAPVHAEVLLLLGDGGPSQSLDLSDLTLLSAAGIRLLEELWSRARQEGLELRVVAAPGCPAYAVLRVLGLLSSSDTRPPDGGLRVHPPGR